ncbi:tape measure protein [Listeria kieliensis]
MADGQIIIDVKVNGKDVDGAAKGMKELETGSKSAGKSIRDMIAAMGLVKIASAAFNVLKSSIGDAVSRFDTMQKFPKVMKALGFSAEDSKKSINKLSDGIDGLPTKLDDVVSSTQQMTAITGDLDKSTDTVLALNNAFLASGAGTEDASRGMQQYNQMISTGQVDLESWKTLQETMPLALQKTAEAMGYTGKSAQRDLYAALKSGKVTFDDFQNNLIKLGTGTGMLAKLAKENSLGIGTSFGNLRNAVSKGVANVITKLDELTKKFTGKTIAQNIDSIKGAINGFFNSLVNVLDFISKFAGIASPAFKMIGAVIKPLVPLFKALAVALAGILIVFTIQAGIDKLSTGLVKLTGFAKTAWAALMANPFALIVGAIAALAYGFYTLYQKSETFRNAINGIVGVIKSKLSPIMTSLRKVINSLIGLWKRFISQFSKSAKETGLAGTAIKLFGSIVDQVKNSLSKFSKWIDSISGSITDFFMSISNKISSVSDLKLNFEGLGNVIKVIAPILAALVSPFGLVVGAIKLLSSVLSSGDIQTGLDKLVSGFSDLSSNILNNSQKVGSAFGDMVLGIAQAISNSLPQIIQGALLIVDGLVTGLISGIPKLVEQITKLISVLLTSFAKAVPKLRESGVKLVVAILNGIASSIGPIAEAATNIILAFLNALAKEIPRIIQAGANLIVKVLEGIEQEVPKVLEAGANLIVTYLEGLTKEMPRVLDAGITFVLTFLQGLTSRLPEIMNTALTFIATFVQGLADNIEPLVTAGINFIVNFLQGIINSLPKIVETVATLIITFLEALTEFLPQIITAGINLIIAFIQGVGQGIPAVIEEITKMLIQIIVAIGNSATSFINAGGNIISKILEGIGNNIDKVITAISNMIIQILDSIRNNQENIRIAAVKLIISFINGIGQSVSDVVNAIWDLIDRIVTTILNSQRRFFDAAIRLLNGLADGFERNRKPVHDAITRLLVSIVKMFVPDLLWNAGEKIIGGFLKGMKSAWEGGKKFVGGIADWIKKNKGPISYDKRLLIPAGKAIMDGLNSGLKDQFSTVQKTVSGMAGEIDKSMQSALNLPKYTAEASIGVHGSKSLSAGTITNAVNVENKKTVQALAMLGGKLDALIQKDTDVYISEKAVGKAASSYMGKEYRSVPGMTY